MDLIGARGGVSDIDALKAAVWKREQTRTTGIGHGLAVPHGKSAVCDRLLMAVGKPAEPIDFQAIDRKPVNVIFLLAGPLNQPGPHVQAMAQISRMMAKSEIRESIELASDSEALYEIICEQEKSLSVR